MFPRFLLQVILIVHWCMSISSSFKSDVTFISVFTYHCNLWDMLCGAMSPFVCDLLSAR